MIMTMIKQCVQSPWVFKFKSGSDLRWAQSCHARAAKSTLLLLPHVHNDQNVLDLNLSTINFSIFLAVAMKIILLLLSLDFGRGHT